MKVSIETEKKLLVLCGVLPVLADYIEDLNMEFVFSKNIKRKANMLMDETYELNTREQYLKDKEAYSLYLRDEFHLDVWRTQEALGL